MRAVIYRDDSAPCAYLVAPVRRRHRGPGRYRWDAARSILIQTDFDQPGLASNLGWSARRAARDIARELYRNGYRKLAARIRGCDHGGTDGTVDCPCGLTASAMIAHAGEWIDAREGRTFNDPGYFMEGY